MKILKKKEFLEENLVANTPPVFSFNLGLAMRQDSKFKPNVLKSLKNIPTILFLLLCLWNSPSHTMEQEDNSLNNHCTPRSHIPEAPSPADFNPDIYLSLHPDLLRAVARIAPEEHDFWARKHYANYGRKEGRAYFPTDFNSDIYLSLHSDLLRAVARIAPEEHDFWARKHYANHGRKERRAYFPTDFNPSLYLSLYPDLLRAVARIAPEEHVSWARKHYANWGSVRQAVIR